MDNLTTRGTPKTRRIAPTLDGKWRVERDGKTWKLYEVTEGGEVERGEFKSSETALASTVTVAPEQPPAQPQPEQPKRQRRGRPRAA